MAKRGIGPGGYTGTTPAQVEAVIRKDSKPRGPQPTHGKRKILFGVKLPVELVARIRAHHEKTGEPYSDLATRAFGKVLPR